MSSDAEVRLDLTPRFDGMYVIGRPGTGKTTFLLSLLRQDMEHGLGLCFLDPHGDAAHQLLALVPTDRRADVQILAASDEGYLFGINPFAMVGAGNPGAVADSVVQIFKRAWGGTAWGPRLEDTLYNLAFVMAETEGTLADCPDFFYDERKRAKRLRGASNPRVVQYWEHEFSVLSAAGQREVRGAVLNKIRQYLSNPLIERIVGAKQHQVDFRKAMDQGKILIVRLPIGQLGEGTVNLLGATVIDQIARSAMSRSNTQDRRPFVLCADEFQRFATPVFGRLIEEARKYKVATMVAHQRRTQLPEEVRDALMSVRTLVVFEVAAKDAQELGREFSGPEAVLMTPPDLYGHLERHGHPDKIITAAFANIRRFFDTFPAQRAHEIRAKDGTPDVTMIRSDVEQSKNFLSRYWAHCQEHDGIAPTNPVWNNLRPDVMRVCVGLGEFPVRTHYRDPTQREEPLSGQPPFTARVKYRDGGKMREATIRTIPPPMGTPWRPLKNRVVVEIEPPNPDDEDEDLFFDEGSEEDPPPISEPYKPR